MSPQRHVLAIVTLVVTLCGRTRYSIAADATLDDTDAPSKARTFFQNGERLHLPPPPESPDVGMVVAPTLRLAAGLVPGNSSDPVISDVHLYTGSRVIGLVGGYSHYGDPDEARGGIGVGLSVGQFATGVRIGALGRWPLTLLIPTLDIGVRFFLETSAATFESTLSLTSDLTGVRVATCLGTTSFHVALRGPTLGLGWRTNTSSHFFTVLGVSLQAGIAF
jgi:hypothetical protein